MSEADDFNRKLMKEFRANGGKVGGMFANTPLLILTARGAKTGLPREHLLAYTTDGDRLVVIASKGGAPTNPQWYHNVKANPDVTVEAGSEKFPAKAIITEGEERQRLFDNQSAQLPAFADYQRNTTRQIPVIALERIDSTTSTP
ncbi:MAG: nitroreductase family deazaflavin-dependent oxidoreductase [Thermomicrobiales bacterium]